MLRVFKLPAAVLLSLALLVLFAAPALAEGQVAQPVQQTDAAQSGGIRPVSPQEFAQRTTSMLNSLYDAASPVADAVAVGVLIASGICALFVIFSGMKLLHRVVGAVLSVGFGLILYYGAPYIVGLFKGLAQHALH